MRRRTPTAERCQAKRERSFYHFPYGTHERHRPAPPRPRERLLQHGVRALLPRGHPLGRRRPHHRRGRRDPGDLLSPLPEQGGPGRGVPRRRGRRRSAARSTRRAPRPTTRDELVGLVIDGLADDVARLHTRGCPFINAAAEYPDPDERGSPGGGRAPRVVPVASSRSCSPPPRPTTRRRRPAQLVLLRDAAMVGGYLDGWERVRPAFIQAATRAAGLAA